MGRFYSCLLFICLLYSCSVSKNYNPNRKFTRQELEQDYSLLRNILEKKHPALYWYTTRDSMNFYFDSLYNNIEDSMTELRFGWEVLAPLTQKVHCGHTSFGMSEGWAKYMKGKTIPSFPLYVKVWGDTMIVTGALSRKDTSLKTGTIITSINSVKVHDMVKKIFQYLPQDGYADNVNYIRISSNFPYYHRNVYGLYKNYRVGYIDSAGNEKTILLPMWAPQPDTSKVKKVQPPVKVSKKQTRKERIEGARSFSIDSNNIATLTLNTFTNGEGRHLRRFFRKTFRKLKEQNVKNLILDLRNNGGGDINMHVLLTKYLRNKPFKVADSAYARAKSFSPYTKYIKQGWLNNIGLCFLTKKRKDGNYHFGYWERNLYKPKTKDHFDGKVYVLINGPTFSASTLFCNAVKGQENIKLVGEEAGGGWYGNSGIMIPDIILPNTRLRVRLPFFRIVQYDHVEKTGRGVPPDIYIPPTTEAVKKGIDRKMQIVKGIIKTGESFN